jgi:hypothetical protein
MCGGGGLVYENKTQMTIQELQKTVPAAFATSPSERASERYAFIPTYELLNQIIERGWHPVRASQSKRTVDQVHALHKIVFRKPGFMESRVGDSIPEITLINSHNLSRRFLLPAGWWRKICSNGMMMPTGIGDSLVERIHLDDAAVDIDQAVDEAVKKLDESVDVIFRWKEVELDWSTRQEFARDAIVLKNGGDAIWSRHFQPHEFLRPRRAEDQRFDLWTVFNVVQENIIKGGVMGVSRQTRPITQVRSEVTINQQLWQLAEKYGQLHGKN